MVEKPKARQFRFRLGTLFAVVAVLSVPLGWVTYSLNWIRERHAFRMSKNQNVCVSSLDFSRPDAPWPLGLFGESGVKWLFPLPKDKSEAERLFPESIIDAEDVLDLDLDPQAIDLLIKESQAAGAVP